MRCVHKPSPHITTHGARLSSSGARPTAISQLHCHAMTPTIAPSAATPTAARVGMERPMRNWIALIETDTETCMIRSP